MASAADIIGHTFQRDELQRDLETGNVAHAYLFTGPKHIGKFTVAKWFAEELLLHGIDDAEERERVRGDVTRLIHSDLLVIDQLWMEDIQEDFAVIAQSSNIPQQHRKRAGAKTDTISIDDVRALQERLIETGSGGYRCCLIRSVERMQAEAVNALLKVLEEPPEHVVFLLTSEAPSLLLPTLISRARVMRFSRLSFQELHPMLKDVPEDEAEFLLHVSQGAPGLIERLKSDPDRLREERQLHSQALSFWTASTLLQRLEHLSPLERRGEEAEHFLLHLALALREQCSEQLPEHATRFQALVSGLETNASRPLLLQRFALSV